MLPRVEEGLGAEVWNYLKRATSDLVGSAKFAIPDIEGMTRMWEISAEMNER